MNVSFLIDNSVSMLQESYKGFSLCEIAKNGVEYIMRQRLRQNESKNDTYYLVQSGFDPSVKGYPHGVSLLSSAKHELSHFFFQLKNIKPHIQSDFADAMDLMYRQPQSFRFLNGADNINGGRDPQKSDPSLFVVFTDACDFFSLEKIEQSIRGNHFHNSWDSTIVIFQLVLPSIIEHILINPEIFSQQLRQSSHSTKSLQDIANALGGMMILVDSYEYLFQTIDVQLMPIFSKPRLNFQLKVMCRTDTEQPGFVDSGIKTILNPISNPLFAAKDIVLGKISYKLNKTFQAAKQKSEYHYIQYSRVLIPERPARMDEKIQGELRIRSCPTFMVDFSKVFCANSASVSKDLEFERQEMEIGDWSRLISPQVASQVKEKTYFPLYSTSLDHDGKAGSEYVLVGLFKVSCRDGVITSIDLLYNMWNFIEFSGIYNEVIARRNLTAPNSSAGAAGTNNNTASATGNAAAAAAAANAPPIQLDPETFAKLERYCERTPYYYFHTLRKIFAAKSLESVLSKKFRFLHVEEVFAHRFQQFCQQYLKYKTKDKKRLEESARLNRMNHLLKKSNCCAASSENYEALNRAMHPKDHRLLDLECLLHAKEEVLYGADLSLGSSSIDTSNPAAVAATATAITTTTTTVSQLNSTTSESSITPQLSTINPYAASTATAGTTTTSTGSSLSASVIPTNQTQQQLNEQETLMELQQKLQQQKLNSVEKRKISRSAVNADSIQRLHFKSEPVSKMIELLKSVRTHELREPFFDEDEIRCIKEPMPFGNPFKMIVRFKGGSKLGAGGQAQTSNVAGAGANGAANQPDLNTSEESYLTNNMQQIKNAHALLLNRVPVLRKIQQIDQREALFAAAAATAAQATSDSLEKRFKSNDGSSISASMLLLRNEHNNNNNNNHESSQQQLISSTTAATSTKQSNHKNTHPNQSPTTTATHSLQNSIAGTPLKSNGVSTTPSTAVNSPSNHTSDKSITAAATTTLTTSVGSSPTGAVTTGQQQQHTTESNSNISDMDTDISGPSIHNYPKSDQGNEDDDGEGQEVEEEVFDESEQTAAGYDFVDTSNEDDEMKHKTDHHHHHHHLSRGYANSLEDDGVAVAGARGGSAIIEEDDDEEVNDNDDDNNHHHHLNNLHNYDEEEDHDDNNNNDENDDDNDEIDAEQSPSNATVAAAAALANAKFPRIESGTSHTFVSKPVQRRYVYSDLVMRANPNGAGGVLYSTTTITTANQQNKLTAVDETQQDDGYQTFNNGEDEEIQQQQQQQQQHPYNPDDAIEEEEGGVNDEEDEYDPSAATVSGITIPSSSIVKNQQSAATRKAVGSTTASLSSVTGNRTINSAAAMKSKQGLLQLQQQQQQQKKLKKEITSAANAAAVAAMSTTRVIFSTRHLISPGRKVQQFLISQKEFFQQMLIIQASQSREELKAFIQTHLRAIEDQQLKEAFKQRISDIVYSEKKPNKPPPKVTLSSSSQSSTAAAAVTTMNTQQPSNNV